MKSMKEFTSQKCFSTCTSMRKHTVTRNEQLAQIEKNKCTLFWDRAFLHCAFHSWLSRTGAGSRHRRSFLQLFASRGPCVLLRRWHYQTNSTTELLIQQTKLQLPRQVPQSSISSASTSFFIDKSVITKKLLSTRDNLP